jgi:hypothetical protein
MVFNLTIPCPNLFIFIVFIPSIVFQLSQVKIELVFPSDTGVDRPVSIPLKKAKEVESSYIVPLLLKLIEQFLALHLTLSTTQKLLNSIKE